MSLHKAVQANNVSEVQRLLQSKETDVNERDVHGNTALHLVKDKTIASLLIDARADPNLQNEDGDMPLHTWHRINLELGIDSAAGTALEIISLLLQAGASPNIQNNHGYNCLHSLFVYCGIAGLDMDPHFMKDFISLFLQFNADVNMGDFEGCTPLHHAVKELHVFNAEMLIASGALVDTRDYRGMTPLQHIFHSDNTEMAQLLLKHKASVNAQDLDGRSALSTAVEVGNYVMVFLLLQDPHICVNLADKNKVTPLHLAAAFKHVELTEMLIQASADLNALDIHNASPLHYAAYGGTPEIVALLLAAGADDKLEDNAGWLAVQYALSRHYYHTALQFGEEYLHGFTASARECVNVADGSAAEDIIVQSLPADDIFTIVEPVSKVYSAPFDSFIVPDDLIEYSKAKSAGKFSCYLLNMCRVPGVGHIPLNMLEDDSAKPGVSNVHSEVDNMELKVDTMEPEVTNMQREVNNVGPEVDNKNPEVDNVKQKFDNTQPEVYNVESEVHKVEPELLEVDNIKVEVENMRRNIEIFMSKWTEKIAELDGRFTGTLFHSGSVYEGTKVGDPNEFDYMLCLGNLARECLIAFDDVTEYDKIFIHKNLEKSGSCYDKLFEGEQLESGKLMSVFVDVAKKALTRLDLSTVHSECYIEGLTEHTLVEDTWALHGTVTCNLKFKWTGLYYKQLVITVDLVPAIPVHQWPQIARQASHLLTNDIRARGCHLVPKTGYWRLSFSLAEKLIMQSLSQEQKSAFIGAKVILHPAVSCKIIVYDDSGTSSEDDRASGDGGLGNDGDIDLETVLGEQDKTDGGRVHENATIREVPGLTNEGDSDVGIKGGSRDSNAVDKETFTLSPTLAGRSVLSQSGEAVTLLKLADAQDCQTIQEWMQNNPAGRVTVDVLQEQELTQDDGSDVQAKTLLPFEILSTYLLKNLFFNCIEQNAKDGAETKVTTKQLFSNLFHSLKESRSIPYYFMPTQSFTGLETLSEDDRCDLVLVAMIMNSLLSEI